MKPQYIITGGPGTGKTSVINRLVEQGYTCVPEVAREIIRGQVLSGGDALPWGNREAYTRLMLEGSVNSFLEYAGCEDILFFDRGIPDTLAYAELINLTGREYIREACFRYRYHPTVFLFPAWKEIYRTDEERKQSWEEAVETYHAMKKVYTELDYHVQEVPFLPVEERVEFILSVIL